MNTPLISHETRQEVIKFVHGNFLQSKDREYIDTGINQEKQTFCHVAGAVFYKFHDHEGITDFTQLKALLHQVLPSLPAWSGREEYRPNCPKVINDKGRNHINIWEPSKIIPSDDDASCFLEFITRCLGSKEKADWFLDFLAYRYQNMRPETKPHHAVYLHSSQGQGKSYLAEILTRVFGDSAVITVSQAADLCSKGSVVNWGRTFLIAEEVLIDHNNRTAYNHIKTFTGRDSVTADEKHVTFSKYGIPAQLIMVSNNFPTFIEAGDRRFFISKWETGLSGTEKDEYFSNLTQWLNRGGYEAIAGLLKNRDVSSYNRIGPPLMTEEKTQLFSLRSNTLASKIQDALNDAINTSAKPFMVFDQDYIDELVEERDRANIKFKMNDLGYTRSDRITVKGRRRYVYYPSGAFIETVKGQPPSICFNGQKYLVEQVLLDADSSL